MCNSSSRKVAVHCPHRVLKVRYVRKEKKVEFFLPHTWIVLGFTLHSHCWPAADNQQWLSETSPTGCTETDMNRVWTCLHFLCLMLKEPRIWLFWEHEGWLFIDPCKQQGTASVGKQTWQVSSCPPLCEMLAPLFYVGKALCSSKHCSICSVIKNTS